MPLTHAIQSLLNLVNLTGMSSTERYFKTLSANTRTHCLFVHLRLAYYLTTNPNMSRSDPPPYSIQDVSQLVNVTVLIEKDGNPTVNLGNLSRPLRFNAITERLIQLGKCATKIDGIRL